MNTSRKRSDNMGAPSLRYRKNANNELYNRLKDLSNTEFRIMIYSLRDQIEKNRLEINRLKRLRDMLIQENEEIKAKKLKY